MVIYKTVNQINGKWYIGKDAKNYYGYLGSGTAILSAIKKYGKENFKKEILEECETLEQLSQREAIWIEQTDAVNDKMSYNLVSGGQGGNLSKFVKNFRNGWSKDRLPADIEKLRTLISEKVSGYKNGMYNKTHTDEAKDKLRNSHLGIKLPPRTLEHCKHLSEALSGKSWTAEQRDKILSKRKPGNKGVTVHVYRKHEHYEFISIKKASDFFGVHRNRITRNQIRDFDIQIENKSFKTLKH